MHHFEPNRSYPSADERGVTTYAVAEFFSLNQHYLRDTVADYSPDDLRFRITAALSLKQLDILLQAMPDAFADLPPTPNDEMSVECADHQAALAADLANPESECAKFARWFEERNAKE